MFISFIAWGHILAWSERMSGIKEIYFKFKHKFTFIVLTRFNSHLVDSNGRKRKQKKKVKPLGNKDFHMSVKRPFNLKIRDESFFLFPFVELSFEPIWLTLFLLKKEWHGCSLNDFLRFFVSELLTYCL